jgi:hypothetical protein
MRVKPSQGFGRKEPKLEGNVPRGHEEQLHCRALLSLFHPRLHSLPLSLVRLSVKSVAFLLFMICFEYYLAQLLDSELAITATVTCTNLPYLTLTCEYPPLTLDIEVLGHSPYQNSIL